MDLSGFVFKENPVKIKAIETVYNGYRFRSRIEARWAVFFDAMGFGWEYEKEGYDLGDLGWYLPDFWLPRVKMWGEVKPVDLTSNEIAKAKALHVGTGYEVLMLVGIPKRMPYYIAGGEIGDCSSNYALSNNRNYYEDENRFYSAFAPEEILEDWFDDMDYGIMAARQARFEHGKNGAANG